MQNKPEKIKEKISVMSEEAGVYQFFNSEGVIIYVGKAKNLKRRVSSYFNKTIKDKKTAMLVKQIADLKYIVVPSEDDALHLENSLIKEFQPKYNILLKDGKTYPWIVVTRENFPRIFLTRDTKQVGGRYYGPYGNTHIAKTVLAVIKRVYPIRSCRHNLTPEAISTKKYAKCLEYHIKNCNAPCEGMESQEVYNGYINEAKQILNGETKQLSKYLQNEMFKLAEEYKFEEAQKIKEKVILIEKYHSRSIIVNSSVNNVDVFGYDEDEDSAYVNYIHIKEGAIVNSLSVNYKKQIAEERENILQIGIADLRERFNSTSKEIIVPFELNFNSDKFTITVPVKGDKKKILDISTSNAKQHKVDRLKQREKRDPEVRAKRLLGQIANDLQLDKLPYHMECFDNSNIQGTNAVSSCVVFKNGVPSKREYRHFNVKTVEGADDYATMFEVMYRRYKRLSEEKSPLPNLIIVDGGKGQLNFAVRALTVLNLIDKVTIVGIAKRLEEIYFPNDPIPLYIDKNSPTLKTIQHMRDEAHRFGITHHRNKRSKTQLQSELDNIKGIGTKTKVALLTEFKSIKRIKEASFEEIAKVIGKSRAEVVINSLSGN